MTVRPNIVSSAPRSANLVWTIFRKEFRETFRDKRTTTSVFVGALLMPFGVMLLFGYFLGSEQAIYTTPVPPMDIKTVAPTPSIGIVGGAESPNLVKAFQDTPGMHAEILSREQAEQKVKSGQMGAVIVLPDDASNQIARYKVVQVSLLTNGSEKSAERMALQAALLRLRDTIVAQRVQEQKLPPAFATPFSIASTVLTPLSASSKSSPTPSSTPSVPISPSKGKAPPPAGGKTTTSLSTPYHAPGPSLVQMLLPYLLLLSPFFGAFYAAIDQVAGEKERGTLETLLASPATRRDIVLGKFGAVVVLCLFSSVLTTIGFLLPFLLRLDLVEVLARGGTKITPATVGVTLLALLPSSVMFSGMLLAVSTFTRNQKEAQAYLNPLLLAVMAPAMIGMFQGSQIPLSGALVPVLNASIMIQQALTGHYNSEFLMLAFVASVVYAAIALMIATRLFQTESVLIKA